ncbi:1-phosphofructokinase [Arthrobacter silviterrae]|uniref:1-phosphofructokinase family hexose kinase n=1 Tax=Arthrobacter silviterrae TaxID=2026658 RepID=A0ABX0D8U5_9MICC|nr:1-phosphofructokinase family hexose kinase [Arthrobacter silviterrae]MDQ0278421.1 1-phosphofructokinase [Arthrobacter silviterrae]NGN82320.1 1-phosphofructokinase family hexose kinase [Arthrobacter silviterrae]
MILTLTPNPSLDRTIELPGRLERGEVQRAAAASAHPGGKGVNIVRALTASGTAALALLPGDPGDDVVLALGREEIPHLSLPIGAPLRSNVAITEPDGTTTKVNEPGPALSAAQLASLLKLAVEKSDGAAWLVLAGSLPPGAPDDFYARVIAAVRATYGPDSPRIAVDSSGAPLAASVAASPDLLKPNAEELAELTGIGDGPSLEADPFMAASAAASLVERGVGAVLATLGSRGAVLVTADGSWLAKGPVIAAKSTVGAGDSALAGYLLASQRGDTPAECLQQAVAHGAAAASLPGTLVPSLKQTHPADVAVTALTPVKEK